jgi:hypothetical protein
MNTLLNKEPAVRVVIASGIINPTKKRTTYTAGGNVVERRVIDTDEGFSR